jgi:RHS repeat-associated protein
MALGSNTVTLEARDTSGNVATKSYSVNLTGDGTTYSYDANGNLATKTEDADSWVYTWNAENQLTKVEKNGGEVASFKYDPLERRVETVAAGATTSFVYDGPELLRQAGSYTRLYVNSPGLDQPIASESGGVLSYVQGDALGTIVATTDATGSVASVMQYDAWGNVESGSLVGSAFTGRPWEASVRLYDYRARWYDAVSGRFLSEDPLSDPSRLLARAANTRPASRPRATVTTHARVNAFWYAEANPANMRDSTGLVATSGQPCSGSSPICDTYGPCDAYLGANARCFCRCADDDPWSMSVRCCLVDLRRRGYSPDEAHLICYLQASALHPLSIPPQMLAKCAGLCLQVQKYSCSGCYPPGDF